jgi:hypothetical protein
MRKIHERRQAFTGNVSGSIPEGASAGSSQPKPGMEALGDMLDFAEKKRGM